MTMDRIQTSYPKFTANQILTHKQLNSLREYLDEQDRLSRVQLFGTGIVCGLKVDASNNGEITIDTGFGMTSAGYFIEFPKTTFTSVLECKCPVQETDTDNNEGDDNCGSSDGTPDFLELITENRNNNIDIERLQEYVVALYLEKKEEKLASCSIIDCNSKGKEIQLNVKVILFKKSDIEEQKLRNIDCIDHFILLGALDKSGGYRNDFVPASFLSALYTWIEKNESDIALLEKRVRKNKSDISDIYRKIGSHISIWECVFYSVGVAVVAAGVTVYLLKKFAFI